MNIIGKRSLFSFTLEELRDYLASHEFARYAADQIYGWLYKKQIFNMDGWSNVSQKIKAHFMEEFDLTIPLISQRLVSVDGTKKYLLQMRDGQHVEAVLIPSSERLTICVSSQIGCAIGCSFCLTGTMGFVRNLLPDEIVGQLLAITKDINDDPDKETRVTNMVFMGQGEPLHNFDNVEKAVRILLEPKGIGLGQRKITVSTAGLVPQMEKLKDFPPVNIAISLHAVTNAVRNELMPINKKYDLESLFEAIKKIPLKSHRAITYEYLLIKDLNDKEEDVIGLVKLLDRSVSKINIIPFNEFPGSKYKRPTEETIEHFREMLLKRGYNCTLRISKGQDILAACGQLKSKSDKQVN